MKKMIGLIALLILMMGLVGCNGETVNIDFPFEVGDVENIEMYHYAGVPVSAEKKVVVAETDITDLYDMFEDLSLEDKQVEETTGADVTAPKNTTDERISRIRLSGISYSETPELSTITAPPSLRHLHPKCSRILSEVSTSDSIGQLCTTLSPPQSTVPASTGKTLFFAP